MRRRSLLATTLAVFFTVGGARAETATPDTALPPESGADVGVDSSLPVDTSLPADDSSAPVDDTSADDSAASTDTVSHLPEFEQPPDSAPAADTAARDSPTATDANLANDAASDSSEPLGDPGNDLGGRSGCGCVLAPSALDRGAVAVALLTIGTALVRGRRRR